MRRSSTMSVRWEQVGVVVAEVALAIVAVVQVDGTVEVFAISHRLDGATEDAQTFGNLCGADRVRRYVRRGGGAHARRVRGGGG